MLGDLLLDLFDTLSGLYLLHVIYLIFLFLVFIFLLFLAFILYLFNFNFLFWSWCIVRDQINNSVTNLIQETQYSDTRSWFVNVFNFGQSLQPYFHSIEVLTNLP